MPNQHKNPGISWHPSDPTLKPWIKAEAERRETTDKVILDEGMGEYRASREQARTKDTPPQTPLTNPKGGTMRRNLITAAVLAAAIATTGGCAATSTTAGPTPDPAASASQSSVAAAQSAIASEVASESAAANAPCTTKACIAEDAEQSLPGAIAGDNSVVTKAVCYKKTVVHHAAAGAYTVKCRVTYSDGTSVTGFANVLLDRDKITFQATG